MANFNVATMEFRKGLNLIYHENTKISVIGLGYVGLPVAVAFNKRNFEVIGFDINKDRVNQLNAGIDKNLEFSKTKLKSSKQLKFSSSKNDLKYANCYIAVSYTHLTLPTKA